MEYILTSKDITPQEAERIGWINKAFDSSQEMYQYISEITSRLTLFPRGGVLAAKAAINYRANPLRADYERDVGFFGPLLANPDFPQILSKATALTKNFTAGEAELNFGEDVVQIYE
ncbi:putative enoyl- hydratase isomerase protein [Botrytis cinerea BcDW1]|nr:putative enoyl- hydratase isomerase protein [Botrytis cinerea BcDW1]